MRVRTKDYERQNRALWGELAPLLERVMFDDDPVLGAAVERFEAKLARYHGVAHAVGMASGTDAIIHMVRALGLGPSDEVVTCAHTFTGVVSALVQAGVCPRLVDADPATGLLEVAARSARAPARCSRCISTATRSRSVRSPSCAASARCCCSRTPRRRMARAGRAGRSAASGRPPR